MRRNPGEAGFFPARRDFRRRGGFSGLTMMTRAQGPWTWSEAAHLVRRAGFGGSPAEISRIHALGREEAVEALLGATDDGFELPEWARPEAMAEEARERFAMLRDRRRAMAGASEEEREKLRQEFVRERQRDSRLRGVEAQQWWFERMRTTTAPLREKMVLFWHDHFASSLQKVREPGLMLRQNELFRRHAFGDFKALTHEVLRDPAMMIYLDVQNSKKGQPNENFAREVMELFTLGEGNYSEADIKEVARAFTGYQLNRLTGTVTHVPKQWDEGEKTVLGKTAAFDGDAIIDLLFEQEAASRYLPSKLWSFFVADEAPPLVVRELSEVFRSSGFRVEAVLREIFLSRAFYDTPVFRDQIKSPVQFLLQLSRELELDSLPDGYATIAQLQLGQSLFLPPNVAGWDWGKGWINTNTLLNRYHVAGVLTKGAADLDEPEERHEQMMEMEEGVPLAVRVAGRRLGRSMKGWSGPDYEKLAPRALRDDPERLVDELVARFFQAEPGTKAKASFVEYARAKKGVVFTNHEVAELCHLMLSTPQYQLA